MPSCLPIVMLMRTVRECCFCSPCDPWGCIQYSYVSIHASVPQLCFEGKFVLGGGGGSSEGGSGYVIPPHLPGGGGLQFVGRWFIRSATEIDDEIIVSGCVYSSCTGQSNFIGKQACNSTDVIIEKRASAARFVSSSVSVLTTWVICIIMMTTATAFSIQFIVGPCLVLRTQVCWIGPAVREFQVWLITNAIVLLAAVSCTCAAKSMLATMIVRALCLCPNRLRSPTGPVPAHSRNCVRLRGRHVRLSSHSCIRGGCMPAPDPAKRTRGNCNGDTR